MYPTIDPGDLSKRTLSPEAIRAVCALYPSTQPATCQRPDTGCTIAFPVPSPVLVVVLVVVVVLALARRRAPR